MHLIRFCNVINEVIDCNPALGGSEALANSPVRCRWQRVIAKTCVLLEIVRENDLKVIHRQVESRTLTGMLEPVHRL